MFSRLFLDSKRSLKSLSCYSTSNFELLTHHFLYQLSNFQLPSLTFLLYSLYPSNSKLVRSIRILFDPLSYPSFTLEWSKNHESAALILDYSWSREVDRAEHEGVKLVRLGWVIDQGRTLDIASLSMFDSTCRDNNIARFVNHKWRESDLSDFGVASRIPGKGKSIQTVKV